MRVYNGRKRSVQGGTEMKKIVVILVVLLLVLAVAMPAYADRHGGHFRGHRTFGGSIWIGPGWDPWWWGGYPYYYPYYPYYYPYYYSPPVIQQQEPQEYIQPAPQEQYYWYYCEDPQGYYPYIKKCPKGWLKVAPTPGPEDEEGR